MESISGTHNSIRKDYRQPKEEVSASEKKNPSKWMCVCQSIQTTIVNTMHILQFGGKLKLENFAGHINAEI